jgi:hypothetical protein
MHQSIALGKSIEIWKNALNHYCGDYSKHDQAAENGYQ